LLAFGLLAHPFDFLVVVDMTQRVVTTIEELPTHANEFDMGRNKQGNTVPREEANYDYNLRSQNFLRTDDKPITTSSPEGVSYSLQGNLIQWQKFNVRVG
jgi:primary-amine oxidase